MELLNISILPMDNRPTEVVVMVSLLFVVIIIFSICGNVLVCAAICSDTHLRQLSNSLYVSLAVADLLVSSVVMLLAMIEWITVQWIFGKIMCNIYISMDIMCSTASILNILTTAIDRFVHIHAPFYHSRIVNGYAVAAVIGLVWTISVMMSFIPIHLGWHLTKNISEIDNVSCALQLSTSYAVISSMISFYLPCIVMVTLYIKLYRFARQHVNTIQKEQSNILGDRNNEIFSKGSIKIVHKKFKTDQKAAITLGVIMGTFLLCWLPFFVINCIKPICQCVPDNYFLVATWLGYFNSCLNPIIYPLFNIDFRNAYKKLLIPLFCKSKKWRHKHMSTTCSSSNMSNYNLNGISITTKVLEEENSAFNIDHKTRRSTRSERDAFAPISHRYKQIYQTKRPCVEKISEFPTIAITSENMYEDDT